MSISWRMWHVMIKLRSLIGKKHENNMAIMASWWKSCRWKVKSPQDSYQPIPSDKHIRWSDESLDLWCTPQSFLLLKHQVNFKHSFHSEKRKYLDTVVSPFLGLVMARQCFPTPALSASAWLVRSILASSSMAAAVIIWMTIDSASLASEIAHRQKRDLLKNVRIR